MTQPQFGADPGRRAEFREALNGTLDCMVGDELVSKPEAAEWAACPDETLSLRLLARSLQTAMDLQQQLSTSAEMMDLANKTLKIMLEDAKAREAWIARKGLAGPERRQKKAA